MTVSCLCYILYFFWIATRYIRCVRVIMLFLLVWLGSRMRSNDFCRTHTSLCTTCATCVLDYKEKHVQTWRQTEPGTRIKLRTYFQWLGLLSPVIKIDLSKLTFFIFLADWGKHTVPQLSTGFSIWTFNLVWSQSSQWPSGGPAGFPRWRSPDHSTKTVLPHTQATTLPNSLLDFDPHWK